MDSSDSGFCFDGEGLQLTVTPDSGLSRGDSSASFQSRWSTKEWLDCRSLWTGSHHWLLVRNALIFLNAIVAMEDHYIQ